MSPCGPSSFASCASCSPSMRVRSIGSTAGNLMPRQGERPISSRSTAKLKIARIVPKARATVRGFASSHHAFTSDCVSVDVIVPIARSPMDGSKRRRTSISSRANVDGRLPGFDFSHSSATCRNGVAAARGSIHAPRASCVR